MARKASGSFRRGPRTLQNESSCSRKEYVGTTGVRKAMKRVTTLGEPNTVELAETPLWTDEELKAAIENRSATVKKAVLVRIDPDVLNWLKSRGPGHTTRVNSILRLAMEADKRR
jgi:uncharacterized protein (DUF4415 family)